MCAASFVPIRNARGIFSPNGSPTWLLLMLTRRFGSLMFSPLIGFVLGGEAGKRLVAGMGLSISPDTLLRLIRAQPEEQVPTPRVLGVDDFSFCKRKTYGTILLDLERRIPIDILPDREATTLETRLKDHEGVEIISRDRGGPYAEGARKGAPDAQQVADRWHLLANLSDALKTFFAGKQAQLKALVQKPPETFSAEEEQQLPAWYSGQTKRKTKIYDVHHQERVKRYHKVRELRAQGAELALIAHQVGISRTTVNKYLNMEHPPIRKTGKRSGPVIDPYKEYIVKWWNDGVRNAQQVYCEIKAMGYTGSDQPVQRYYVQFRGEEGKPGLPLSTPCRLVLSIIIYDKCKRKKHSHQASKWCSSSKSRKSRLMFVFTNEAKNVTLEEEAVDMRVGSDRF